MTKPSVPFKIRNAATLPVSAVNTNLAQAEHDVADGLQQRYTYSDLTINFGRIDHLQLGNDLKQFTFQPPYYFEIIGVTLVAVTEGDQTLTLSCTGLSGWEDVIVETETSHVRYVSQANFVASGAANSTPLFTLDFNNNDTDIVACRVTLNIRTDRGNAGSSHAGYTATRIAAGDSLAASVMNTEFTNIQDAVVRDTANNTQMRMQMFNYKAAIAPMIWRIPSSGRRIIQIDCGVQGAGAGNSATWALKDENGTTISTASTGTTIGYTLKTSLQHTTGLPDTQTPNDPGDENDDYTLVMTPTVSGSHYYGYCVIYYS